MTILGKILVFVNLVFSLVTGALAIIVYVTQNNWADGFDKLKNNYQVSEANSRMLKEALKQKEEKMVTMESQNTRWRNDAITADITAKSEQERNRQLLEQVAALTKELERRQAPGAQRPPAEGTVLETDAKSDLVTISIGSDSGVKKGNKLVVYRLKPRPEYIGELSVIDSQPKEAVARPIKPLRAGPVQKGDIVASRVMATGR
jgi:cell shape-determining protein MreC